MTSINWLQTSRAVAQRDYGADIERLCRQAAVLVALLYAAGYCLGDAVHRCSAALAALATVRHRSQQTTTAPITPAATITPLPTPAAAAATPMAKPMAIEPVAVAAVTTRQPSSRRRTRKSKAA